ncbi:hypothetical protein U1Q18_044559 [Sarracenia purpurea var. burkii]
MRNLEKGKEIHDLAVQQSIDSDILVTTPLMTMYAKCGDLEKAKNLFMELQGRDVVAWSAAIAVFAQFGYPREALSTYAKENMVAKPSLSFSNPCRQVF